jgi:hypothetical protein
MRVDRFTGNSDTFYFCSVLFFNLINKIKSKTHGNIWCIRLIGQILPKAVYLSRPEVIEALPAKVLYKMNNITNQKEYQKYPRKKKQQQHNKYKVKKKNTQMDMHPNTTKNNNNSRTKPPNKRKKQLQKKEWNSSRPSINHENAT